MKIFVAVLALIAVVAAQDDMYTTKYDSLDVDEILKSDRLFKNYYNCLMDAGPCTPEGTEMKRRLPEVIETNCSKCSAKQRDDSLRAVKYMTENRAEEWKALKVKLDPENKYVDRYLAEASFSGLKL